MELIDKHKKWIDGAYMVYLYAKSSFAYCRDLHEGSHVYSRHLKELRYITFAYSIVELHKLCSGSSNDKYSLINCLKECSKDKYLELGYDLNTISQYQGAFDNKASIIDLICTYRDNRYAHTNPRNISLEVPTNVFDEIDSLLELTLDCINYLGITINHGQLIDEGFIDLTGFHVA